MKKKDHIFIPARSPISLKPSLTIAALTALLLTGCSSEGDDMAPDDTTREIRLNVEHASVTEGRWATRATYYDAVADLQTEGTFRCFAYQDGTTTAYDYIDNTNVNFSNSVWTFANGTHNWPETKALNFFAHMPAELPGTTKKTYCKISSYTEDTPVISCSNLPVNITRGSDEYNSQNELIVAYTPGQTMAANAEEGVTLTFRHPFARVGFQLTEASGSNVTVNSISIADVYNSGTCTFNGAASPQTFSWSPTNAQTFTISKGENDHATSDDDTYLVIPYSYGDKTLTVNATWDEWGNVTKDVTTTITCNWEPGNCYIYKLTLSEYAVVVDVTDKYTEQW